MGAIFYRLLFELFRGRLLFVELSLQLDVFVAV